MSALDDLGLVAAHFGNRGDDEGVQRVGLIHARVFELVAADHELDAAADELADAKRAKGNWRVNPLNPDHPAVLRMRAAKARRAAALAAFGESA